MRAKMKTCKMTEEFRKNYAKGFNKDAVALLLNTPELWNICETTKIHLDTLVEGVQMLIDLDGINPEDANLTLPNNLNCSKLALSDFLYGHYNEGGEFKIFDIFIDYGIIDTWEYNCVTKYYLSTKYKEFSANRKSLEEFNKGMRKDCDNGKK